MPFRLALYTTYLIYFSLRNRFRVRFYFMCAAVRMIFLTLSGRQIQYLTPTTRQSYQVGNQKGQVQGCPRVVRRCGACGA